MKDKKYHTVRAIPKSIEKYHTVRTIPKSIEKYHTVRTIPKSIEKYHTVRAIPKSIEKYHTVRAIPKSIEKYHTVKSHSKIRYQNRRKRKNRYPNTQIHTKKCSLSWLGIGTSIKGGGNKLVLWAQTSPLSEMMINTHQPK